MLWGEVLSRNVFGDGGGELGGCGTVGVGVEEVAGEGYCCLRHRGWGVLGIGMGLGLVDMMYGNLGVRYEEFAFKAGIAAQFEHDCFRCQ